MATTVSGKLETTMELHCPAEKFYNIWKKEAHLIPDHTPAGIQDVKVHEGSWDTHGSIKVWNYTCEGNAEVFKELVEHDDANMSFTLIGVGGHVMEIYKVYNCTWKATPNGDGCLVKITIDFEKLNPSVPSPDKYFNMLMTFTKDIDQGLTKP